jgi:hypothetical protein
MKGGADTQGAQMTTEQLAEIEHHWRNRPAPVYLYDRKRGLMNATTDVLALIEALRQAQHELAELRRKQPDDPSTE